GRASWPTCGHRDLAERVFEALHVLMRWLSILGVYAAACGAGARSATADAGCDAPGPCTGQLSGGLQASVTCTGLFGSNWGHPPFACYPQWTMTGQGPDLSLKFLDDSVLKILEITTTDGGVFKGHVWNGPSNVGAISVQSQMTCSLCPDDSCGNCHRWYTGTLD